MKFRHFSDTRPETPTLVLLGSERQEPYLRGLHVLLDCDSDHPHVEAYSQFHLPSPETEEMLSELRGADALAYDELVYRSLSQLITELEVDAAVLVNIAPDGATEQRGDIPDTQADLLNEAITMQVPIISANLKPPGSTYYASLEYGRLARAATVQGLYDSTVRAVESNFDTLQMLQEHIHNRDIRERLTGYGEYY
ncbi:MAG TPA: hypothetical protein VJP80_02250 [Candidatus Saccharimonadales bacterium]|nr:hypothetical protein [Candidatus Saccharimonadales bacterium]